MYNLTLKRIVKRIVIGCFSFMLVLSMLACSTTIEPIDSPDATSKNNFSTEAPSKPDIKEYIIIPYIFANSENDKISESLTNTYNITNYTINADKSVTLRLTENEKAVILENIHNKLSDFYETLYTNKYDADFLECITDIKFSEDFKQIDVFVNDKNYSPSVESCVSLGNHDLIIAQSLSGFDSDNISITTNIILNGTYEILNSNTMTSVDFTVDTPLEHVTVSASPEPIIEEKTLVDGDEVHIDGVCDFKVLGWSHADEIVRNGMLKITGCRGENNTNLWVMIEVTNRSNEELDIGNHAGEGKFPEEVELVYDNQYSFDGGSACWGDLYPLSTEEVYILYYVPKSIIEGNESMVAHFTIAGQRFAYTIR